MERPSFGRRRSYRPQPGHHNDDALNVARASVVRATACNPGKHGGQHRSTRLAVSRAIQSILSDLFASLAIGLDKPFEIGDFIVRVCRYRRHHRGYGLKTTCSRSLGGEQIVCGNTELLRNTIPNYNRMEERRIDFGFDITYDCTPDELRAVPRMEDTVISALTSLVNVAVVQ